ncbi:MAG: alpha/beta hydrolase [Chloroflexota bacterium]
MQDQFINIRPEEGDLNIHVRIWQNDTQQTPFVLVHGLASNSRTWDAVAQRLHETGHTVVTVDQRGHGLSDKPTSDVLENYGFEAVAMDLKLLIDKLNLNKPILVGQSWGGNVMLAFGALHPGVATGLGFVDGGYLDLQSRPDATWEKISTELRPPKLTGIPRADMKARMQRYHPDWTDQGIEGTLGNFETLEDGTVRPWLSLDRHMAILRAMWDQRPTDLYPHVTEPVLICPTRNLDDAERFQSKAASVERATTLLPKSTVHWFDNTDHDIHVHRPQQLADVLLHHEREGIWVR